MSNNAASQSLQPMAARLRRFAPVLLAFLTLAGCGRGPTEADMAGCATSNRAITHRDVADCAADRAEIRRERER